MVDGVESGRKIKEAKTVFSFIRCKIKILNRRMVHAISFSLIIMV